MKTVEAHLRKNANAANWWTKQLNWYLGWAVPRIGKDWTALNNWLSTNGAVFEKYVSDLTDRFFQAMNQQQTFKVVMTY